MVNGYNLANVVNTKAYASAKSVDVTAMAARDHEVGKASQELIAVCYRQCKVKSKIQAGGSLLSCHGFVIFLIFWYLFCNQVLL